MIVADALLLTAHHHHHYHYYYSHYYHYHYHYYYYYFHYFHYFHHYCFHHYCFHYYCYYSPSSATTWTAGSPSATPSIATDPSSNAVASTAATFQTMPDH